MTVSELIIELARCEDQNAEVVFAHVSDRDEENVAFNVHGQAKKDAPEVQWIRDIKPDVAIFILG